MQRPASATGGGGGPSIPQIPPSAAAAVKPVVERDFSTDVLNIANVDVDAEQNSLMADLARPSAPQTGANSTNPKNLRPKIQASTVQNSGRDKSCSK